MNTIGEPWGKLDRAAVDRANAPRLTLIAHCIDVAAVMAALLALPTMRRRLSALSGRELTACDIERLVALAFLHDIGKAGAGFQSRGMAAAIQRDWQQRSGAGRAQMGHVTVVAPLFCGDRTSFKPWMDALGIDAISAWGGDSQTAMTHVFELWLAAISHHGEPVTLKALSGLASTQGATWTHPIAGYEPLHGLQQLGDAARTLFAGAFIAEPMAPFAPGLVHAVAGLVSLADWIGSNTDTAFFPYGLGCQTVARWPIARQRATDVLRSMHLDVDAARADLCRRTRTFAQVFGVGAAHDAQRQAAEWQGDHANGRIVVLEAETGGGKTEAALWRFKTLFAAGEVDALCFLLPTRVAATGIYSRLQRFIDALFPDPTQRPPTVLAVPGYLRANGNDGQRVLAGFEVLWPDGDDARRRPLYWAAENSKRYFAASALAGTIDQFLLSTLQVKHAHLRGSLALRSLVVVDEVHASDAYMTALLRAALDRHVRAGGHALLMSATLTGDARQRLLLAGAPRAAAGARAELAAPDAPYPAVSTLAGVRACVGAGRSKQLSIALHPLMRDAAGVAALATAELASGARVLVLRNTVRQAVATQQALEDMLGGEHGALFRVAGVRAMHHGRYAFEDRQLLDARVDALFGKEAALASDARVLVGTQTLEISVDCDSDVMITDLAPVDVLLQRLGRLHRHAARDRLRPAHAAAPRVVVLTPPGRDLAGLLNGKAARGLGIGPRSAYENLLSIEATWQLLERAIDGGWNIPRDNRRLVETGASLQALQRIADALGGPWPAHFSAVYGKLSAQAAHALPVLMQWHKAWGEGGWSELDDDVRTRLGLDSIDIELPQPWTTPLGARIERLPVPAWMLRGNAPHDVTQLADAGDQLLVSVGTTQLIYDRLGLRTS